MNRNVPEDVDEYISGFPEEVQKRLKKIREIIKKEAPDAKEVISYAMPAYKLNGMLLYYAGFKNHIGFYPMASGIAKFKKEISEYKSAKGSVQFPHNKPFPLVLIGEIVKYRVTENKILKRK